MKQGRRVGWWLLALVALQALPAAMGAVRAEERQKSPLPLIIASILHGRPAASFPFSEPQVTGRTYHLDPVAGSLDNDGSANAPWPGFDRIRHLIGPEGTIRGGDALVLRSGYHGDVELRGINLRSYLTVKAAPGQTPVFSRIALYGCSRWYFKGLTIRREDPDIAGRTTLFTALDHGWHGPASHIILKDSTLLTRREVDSWSAADWSDRACNGITLGADHSLVLGNALNNVSSGITITGNAVTVADNTIDGFCHDGMRGNGNDLLFLRNVVLNTYDVDENHDDGFQSFIVSSSGTDAWERVTLSGNVIIGTTDPDRPLAGYLQGIGCFDGFYRDWVIENNIILVDHWHGITLMGAENCRIVNNTVVANTLAAAAGPPWIRVVDHKDGRPSSGCVVANNIAHSYPVGEGVRLVSNYDIDDPAAELPLLFVDWQAGDVHLLDHPGVVDQGSSLDAPAEDREGTSRPRGGGVDLGALERR